MGFFSKAQPKAASPATFGPGRVLQVANDMQATVDGLTRTLDDVSPTPYEHMRPLGFCRVSWHGSGEPPTWVASASYQSEDNFSFAFWPEAEGTRIHAHILGGATNHPLFGEWKQREPSLGSRGPAPAGSLALTAPVVWPTYLDELVTLGHVRPTPHNISVASAQVCEMFLIKASQFLSNTVGQSASMSFLNAHPETGPGAPQQILDDLVTAIPGVVPYVQDLPERIRGLLLERNDQGELTGKMWPAME